MLEWLFSGYLLEAPNLNVDEFNSFNATKISDDMRN